MAEVTPFDDGELYDRLLGDFDFGRDFYVELARKAGGPVLDVCCGTGRILLPCLEAGVDAEGLDLYQPMLDQLRRNATERRLDPKLHQADMSDFRLEKRYALIMIPFNAFIHNLTADSQIKCLTTCREHLTPNGMLVFDTFFPSPEMLRAPVGIRVLELDRIDPKSAQRMRVYDTRTLDLVKQTQHSRIDVEFLDDAETITRVVTSETTTHWFYKTEMELLLRLAGYSKWELFGDFNRKPLDSPNDLMVVMATR